VVYLVATNKEDRMAADRENKVREGLYVDDEAHVDLKERRRLHDDSSQVLWRVA